MISDYLNQSAEWSRSTMTQEQWTAVDDYFTELFIPDDQVLEAALQASDAAEAATAMTTP
jgi:hypothetical protein